MGEQSLKLPSTASQLILVRLFSFLHHHHCPCHHPCHSNLPTTTWPRAPSLYWGMWAQPSTPQDVQNGGQLHLPLPSPKGCGWVHTCSTAELERGNTRGDPRNGRPIQCIKQMGYNQFLIGHFSLFAFSTTTNDIKSHIVPATRIITTMTTWWPDELEMQCECRQVHDDNKGDATIGGQTWWHQREWQGEGGWNLQGQLQKQEGRPRKWEAHAVHHENKLWLPSWFVFIIYPSIPPNFSSLQQWPAKIKWHWPQIWIPNKTVKPHHWDNPTTSDHNDNTTTMTTLSP